WPYLLERAKKNKVKLVVGRDGSEPHSSTYGHVSVTGRGNVDLYDLARQLYEVKRKTLENVAEYLGVIKISERIEINKMDIWKLWDDEKKRETLLKYSKDDVLSTYGIGEMFLPFALQMASIIGMPVDQVMSASTGARVEQYLMHQAFKRKELIPNAKQRKHVPYVGGLVLKPEPGLHDNVAVFDFSSMYPNIMIQYNISPDTYIPPGEKLSPEKVNVAPHVDHRFRKEPEGFYKAVLRHLLAWRKEIRDRMKKLDKKSLEYRLLENRQKAIKILANATYGYAGWNVARWYMKEVAEATSAWGRATIQRTIKIAKNSGLKVYYGDTDSVFVSHDKDKVEKFESRVDKELGLDIGVDKIYERVFFTEAKKRYCGLLEDDSIDVVGFETIRGDWTELAKNVQEQVIEIILREKSAEKAVKYVQEVLEKLDKGKISFEDLIIWKTLTQRIERYKARSAHIEAAKQLIDQGVEVHVGNKIGYVICAVEGERLLEKAKPHQLAKPEEIDLKYYKEKQVIPAALRILKGFGVTEDELKTKKKQVSMESFFETKK
ncbi:MAG: DNA-directed DNA polymerase, partial [Candidatus Hodarchaeota archaeon]